MLTTAGSAVAVVAVVVGLVAWIAYAISQTETPVATPSADPAPAVTESTAPFPPVPAGADPALSTKPAATAGTGPVTALKATPIVQGAGAAVQAGQTITVNYVGVTYADGQEFDSSWNSAQPFTFQLGAGNVIQGWDQGLVGATVGSRIQLDIPADLAYGDNPSGGQPAGTLRFIVDILSAS